MNDVSTDTTTIPGSPRATQRRGQTTAAPRTRTGDGTATGHAIRRPSGLARALGWFSVGLGVAQLVAPRRVARLIGAPDGVGTRTMMRLLGARELSAGIGLLARRRATPWLWARLAGDVMDLALLGNLLRRNGRSMRAGGALAAVAGVTVLDAWASRTTSRDDTGENARQPIRRSITIARTPAEVYRFWRDLKNLPRFMVHLESVETLDKVRSYWRARGPAGKSFEWNAEIVEDRENELIAWRSIGGAGVANSGVVRFLPAPGGRGTEIHVEASYEPPAGAFGRVLAQVVGQEPNQQVQGDLRRLKQVLEIGEVVQSDASIHRGMHPARPSVGPSVRKAVRS